MRGLLGVAAAVLVGCGGATGTCTIDCCNEDGCIDVGPYYVTSSQCVEERKTVQEEVESFGSICEETWVAD